MSIELPSPHQEGNNTNQTETIGKNTDTFFKDAELLEKIILQKIENDSFGPTTPKERTNILKTDNTINTLSRSDEVLRSFLERYGVDIALEKISPTLFSIDTSSEDLSDFETLPEGYAYIGGSARSVLARVLKIDTQATPRDIDIVRISTDDSLDEELSMQYMPDDFKHGYGVKEIDEDYFETRDFTINEVLFFQNKIFLSKECLLDTVRGIIRFTNHEKKESYYGEKYYINDKLMAKAVRVAAERFEDGQSAKIEKEVFEFQDINYFHISLHLDRALEQGNNIAQTYVNILKRLKQIPENISTPEKLQEFLKNRSDFVFRFCAKSTLEKEKEMLRDEEFFEKFQDSTAKKLRF